jgi:hypothetical protein
MAMSSYLFSMLVATMLATQATPSRPAVPKKDPTPTITKKDTTPPITLTGCVNPNAAAPGSYTFSDTRTGATYRLSGVDVQKDAGTRGAIVVGTGARRVTIRGGLVPSPNVAAQAGAIDAVKAANASMPGGTNSGAGSAPLPEFRATQVKAINGTCP